MWRLPNLTIQLIPDDNADERSYLTDDSNPLIRVMAIEWYLVGG